jgi:hypothetical protein
MSCAVGLAPDVLAERTSEVVGQLDVLAERVLYGAASLRRMLDDLAADVEAGQAPAHPVVLAHPRHRDLDGLLSSYRAACVELADLYAQAEPVEV